MCTLLLTHWGRVTHICVTSNLTIIGSDIGLSPDWRQVIIWTSGEILLIGLLGTNFSEILIGILTFSFKKVRLKMSFGKWRPFVSALIRMTAQQQCCWDAFHILEQFSPSRAWISEKFPNVSWHEFSNLASDWLQHNCQPIRSHVRKSLLLRWILTWLFLSNIGP